MKNNEGSLDHQTLNAIAGGNQAAFKRLFDHYYEFVIQLSCLYLSYQDAEEISLDIFTKLWNNRRQLPEIDSLKNYLFILTRNECLSRLKRKKIETQHWDDVYNKLSDFESTPQSEMELDELHRRVELVIAALPPKCREAFYLVREEGLCYKDAAVRMGISENTLDAHLKKATKSILAVVTDYRTAIFFLSIQ